MDARIKAVMFDPEQHTYSYNGRTLHGVTGTIGRIMGKSFPDTPLVNLATTYGHDVHRESELWIKEGREPSSDGGKYVVQYLKDFNFKKYGHYEAELLVSDFEGTASSIDVVLHTDEGAYLFDIKTTGTFDRRYCSLQLSVYRDLFKAVYGEEVLGMAVIGVKSRMIFTILYQGEHDVKKILEMNKNESKEQVE